MMLTTTKAFELLREERSRQRTMHGYSSYEDEKHTVQDWLAIIVHETGCLAAACLPGCRKARLRAIVKIGAVCVAALEVLASDETTGCPQS